MDRSWYNRAGVEHVMGLTSASVAEPSIDGQLPAGLVGHLMTCAQRHRIVPIRIG